MRLSLHPIWNITLQQVPGEERADRRRAGLAWPAVQRRETGYDRGIVESLLGQQTSMGTPLNDLTMVNHQDLVCFADRTETMGDDKAGFALAQLGQRILNLGFVSTSTALVLSSKINTSGWVRMARAIAMRCFCPPDRLTPRCPTIES